MTISKGVNFMTISTSTTSPSIVDKYLSFFRNIAPSNIRDKIKVTGNEGKIEISVTSQDDIRVINAIRNALISPEMGVVEKDGKENVFDPVDLKIEGTVLQVTGDWVKYLRVYCTHKDVLPDLQKNVAELLGKNESDKTLTNASLQTMFPASTASAIPTTADDTTAKALKL